MRSFLSPIRIAALLAAVVIGSYYHWQVRAAGYDIVWAKGDLPGYYNYLAQALTSGHLYLPVEPSPALLALPNPWDPNVDASLKLWDTALFNRHFYLYHGIGPALMAFVPWRLMTGNDLPENAGMFAFAFAGYLFSLGSLLGLIDLAKLKPPAFVAFMAFLALGVCQNVPFLIHRVWVYELAIAGGYFCVSAGIFFLIRYFCFGSHHWLWPAGLFFGMAVACRPHLGLVGALAFLLVLSKTPRRFAAFVIPFVLVCAGICLYNFERFGNPLQFGTKYLLGNANQNEVHWRLSNLRSGFHFLLTVPPRVTYVFPWFRAVQRPPGLPPESAFEPIVGGLWMAPFFFLTAFSLFTSPARRILWLLVASGAGIVLFIAGTGWSVQRYEADFLPLFVLAALLSGLENISGRLLILMLVPGFLVSLVFGFTGPYDETIHNKPARYVRIAGWFSPIDKYRPRLNPKLEQEFTRPAVLPDGTRDVLISTGSALRYELRLEQTGVQPILVSQTGRYAEVLEKRDLPPSTGPRRIRAVFDSTSQTIMVMQNGEVVLTHKLPALITAPSEIHFAASERV